MTPLDHIAAMAPYALADVSVPHGVTPIQMSQNESLRAPSPHTVQAAAEALQTSHLYPDPDWSDLRQALARHHDIPAGQILCGAGSLDLISAIARVYSGPDRAVLAPKHAYPFFRTATQMAGARFDVAEETEGHVDTSALLNALKSDTRLVFVANPANPTGTRISSDALRQFRQALPENTLLVIDEAYGEFADLLDRPNFDLVEGGNTVVLRTFSKAYGLAGARIGWGLFPSDVAVNLRKVMNPNNVSAASQAAALAALRDDDYMRRTCAMTSELRNSTQSQLTEAGFRVLPSHTNFLTIDLQEARIAQAVDCNLRAQGIFLRAQGGAGLPHMLRMTVGENDAMSTAIAALIAARDEVPV